MSSVEEHFICQSYKKIKEVVIVGACDGVLCDTIAPFIDLYPRWKPYLIEPVRRSYMDLVHRFGDYENVVLINSALKSRNGVMNINTIDRDYESELPTWAPGISSFHSNEVVKSLQEHMIQEEVQTITVSKFLGDYHICNVDLLQIDVEGDDYRVFMDFWELGFQPKIIKIEIKNCKSTELDHMFHLFNSNDYQTYVQGEDVVAISNTL
jgi:FkbM family methyltransferase